MPAHSVSRRRQEARDLLPVPRWVVRALRAGEAGCVGAVLVVVWGGVEGVVLRGGWGGR